MIEVILFLKSSKDICYIILSELFALLVFHHQKHLLVKYLFTAVKSKLEFTSKQELTSKIQGAYLQLRAFWVFGPQVFGVV